MKFNEVEIFINAHNEIVIRQICGIVRITKDQADIVADEIKKLAKQLKEEEDDETNEK